MHFRVKCALFVALILTPCQAAAMAQSQNYDRTVATAVNAGPVAMNRLLAKAGSTHNVALEAAILRDSGVVGDDSAVASQARYRSGCKRASISSTHYIKWPAKSFGVTIGWERVTLHGFCWNGNKITFSGGETTKRWSSFAYCWKDTSEGDNWAYYPTWRQSFAAGTLGGNAVWGCISLQADETKITYANGGGVWRH